MTPEQLKEICQRILSHFRTLPGAGYPYMDEVWYQDRKGTVTYGDLRRIAESFIRLVEQQGEKDRQIERLEQDLRDLSLHAAQLETRGTCLLREREMAGQHGT